MPALVYSKLNLDNDLKIDIVIPVYNEGANIERTLMSLYGNVQDICAQFKVVVVYDFDEDNTLPVIGKMRSTYALPIQLLKNESGGVCNAIKKGLHESVADYVLVTMADMSDDYSSLTEMVAMAKTGYDIICASRYMHGGKMYGGPFIKKMISRIAGTSLHFLKGVPTHDITNSYKLYSIRMLRAIQIESVGGFEIAIEITAKAYLSGYCIGEVPTQWWDRTEGTSRFNMRKWIPLYLKWYLFLLFGKKT